jgi:glycerate kinase
MRFLIAPDAFKGSLTAEQASEVIAKGIHGVFSDAELILCPLADGGEGTAEVLRPYLDDDLWLIESAELIGINLSVMSSQSVEQRGSSSIGDAMLRALDAGKRNFIIALGGSATNDAGLGMLMSLGVETWDSSGKSVEPALTGLRKLARVDISKLDRRLTECSFTILTDVASPLYGKNGATAVYGPQKGVDESEVTRIDHAISAFADMCAGTFGFDPCLKEGAGAAGGLGYALMLIGGEAVSGAEYVMEKTGFIDQLNDADWVITGEGCSDAQTLQGKLPIKVAQAARASGVKVALLSGSVDMNAISELEKRFDLVVSALPGNVTIEQAMRQPETLLVNAVIRLSDNLNLPSLR